jgi:phage shock protein A
MIRRIINCIKAVMNRLLNQVEDPETLLSDALDEMRDSYSDNQQRAINAVSQKYQLSRMVDNQKSQLADIASKIDLAVSGQKRDLAKVLILEKLAIERALAATTAEYDSAITICDDVKRVLDQQESAIQLKTAEATANVARWQRAQISRAASKMSDNKPASASWARAIQKTTTAECEADATAEIQSASLSGQITEMQLLADDATAESMLQQIEIGRQNA